VLLPIIDEFLREFAEAAPSTASMVQDIRELVDAGQLYKALKSAKQLIQREQEILNDFVPEELSAGAGAG
jgi:flagellar biosynthesis regulator FlbT